ncbi:Protein of unknown function [Pyronema omphalodes CBS 100304]|uniref:Uncharacterized protein n=1 Tax=Pyronema omphalodes (strain CBS 100304) TaxID=1076935 RepID=U4LK53_PYROM|nr:Protein of unknown function [Pyronema omphalodes CBS 100304]
MSNTRPTAVSCSVLESYSEWNELPKSFAEDRVCGS